MSHRVPLFLPSLAVVAFLGLAGCVSTSSAPDKKTLQQAAELTVQNGAKFFVIEAAPSPAPNYGAYGPNVTVYGRSATATGSSLFSTRGLKARKPLVIRMSPTPLPGGYEAQRFLPKGG